MKDFELEKRLAELRKKWQETKDPILRMVIERQAKALKRTTNQLEKTFEKAKGVFK